MAITLSYGARPLGSFLALWITPKKVSIFLSLTVLTSLLCGFVVLVAAQSPHPLLKHSAWGGIIAVRIVIWVFIRLSLGNGPNRFGNWSKLFKKCDYRCDKKGFSK